MEKGQALTLQQLQEIARTFEAVKRQTKRMGPSSDAHVNRVEDGRSRKSEGGKGDKSKRGNECSRCGRQGHFARDPKCPAKDKECSKCHKKGHFAAVCKTKGKDFGKHKVSYVNEHGNNEDDEYAFNITDETETGKITVTVGGVPVDMLIDSGASTNVINRSRWEELKKKHIKCVSTRAAKKLYAYGATTPLQVIGTFTADVSVAGRCISSEFAVIEGKGEPLLGRKSAIELGVLKLHIPEKPVNSVTVKEDLIARYKDLFQGVGKLEGYQVKLHINPEVQPVAQPLRRPAFSLREKIERKLDELMQEDIIEKVEGPTPWVNPVVVVPKPNGDVRLCVDMRCANKAILRERHPIPTIEEILQDMQEGGNFSKLDLKWGYHQIELCEESRSITTFVTHRGLFRYKRLMFGINSAPEKYQQVIQQVLQDCSGTANISDDVIVYGSDQAEHDRRLEKVLTRLKERGLTLNKDKCVFNMSKLTFMGLVLSQQGIGPTEEKVKAVKEAREPQNVSEVKSFLGLVNFNARFIPDLATIAEPLRRLTKKGVPFVFGPEQRKSFRELKQRLTQAETLGYFDRNAKTKIVCDASPVGLGAILLQEKKGEDRVICYASRGLTNVERRYSQTEKEALGVVWACERFHIYLYGRNFELWTDHKPFEFIYSAHSKPSARIERWALRLQPYSFKVKYLPGHPNVADLLSRLTKMGGNTTRNVAEEYINFVAKTAVPSAMTAKEIGEESDTDEELIMVRQCIKTGKWDGVECASYKPVRDELCIVGKMVLRGTRIVVPKKLRPRVIELGHEGHQGIMKMKQRLRTKVWWPGIDKEAENFCKSCHGCQVMSKPSDPKTLLLTLWVHYLHETVFIVTDYYSRYVEINISKKNTVDVAIDTLENMFATHGLPLTVTSDNGPHFIAESFETFLKQNGIEHRKVTPLWPQANGEIERQNRSLLKRMKIAQVEGQDWKKAVQTYLVAYRNTPHPTTGMCPAELMFRRTLRTKLPDLRETAKCDEEMRDQDKEKKMKIKDYADLRRNAKENSLAEGDKVLLRQQRVNKWSTPFESQPYEVINKHGNSVVIESPEGVQYKRNSTHVKQYQERDPAVRQDAPETQVTAQIPLRASDDRGDQGSNEVKEKNDDEKEEEVVQRPMRTRRMPKRFEDYVLR